RIFALLSACIIVLFNQLLETHTKINTLRRKKCVLLLMDIFNTILNECVNYPILDSNSSIIEEIYSQANHWNDLASNDMKLSPQLLERIMKMLAHERTYVSLYQQ